MRHHLSCFGNPPDLVMQILSRTRMPRCMHAVPHGAARPAACPPGARPTLLELRAVCDDMISSSADSRIKYKSCQGIRETITPPTTASKSTTQLYNNNTLDPRLSTTCAFHLSQPSSEHSAPSPTPLRTSSAPLSLPYRLSSEEPSSDLCPQFLSSAPCSAALAPEKCRIPSRKVKMSGVRC